jgi:hypothetical protein
MLKQVVHIITIVLYSVKSDNYIELIDAEFEIHSEEQLQNVCWYE